MKNKKGFTLVELMIVIVVIGILAAMMMFSSTEAINEAKATKIITDLETLKKAGMSYYADHYNEFRKNPEQLINVNQLIEYVGKDHPDLKNYKFTINRNNTDGAILWFVFYRGDELKNNKRIREKIESRARTHRLFRNTGAVSIKDSINTVNYELNNAFFEENIYKADDGENSNIVILQIR